MVHLAHLVHLVHLEIRLVRLEAHWMSLLVLKDNALVPLVNLKIPGLGSLAVIAQALGSVQSQVPVSRTRLRNVLDFQRTPVSGEAVVTQFGLVHLLHKQLLGQRPEDTDHCL